MKNEFVPYEQAFALLDLGFDEPCVACFTFGNKKYIEILEEFTTSSQLREQMDRRLKNILEDDQDQYTFEDYFDVQDESSFAAPTFSQAFRFFREKYRLNSETPYLPNVEKYGIIVSDMTIKPKDLSKNENFKRGVEITNNFAKYDKHEEAELACLKKLIKIVKKQVTKKV